MMPSSTIRGATLSFLPNVAAMTLQPADESVVYPTTSSVQYSAIVEFSDAHLAVATDISNWGSDILDVQFTGTKGRASILPELEVIITPADVSVIPGATQQFSAEVSGIVNQTVTWSASYGSVNSSGLYTAPGTTGSGVIYASSDGDAVHRSGTTSVTVATPALPVRVTASILTNSPFGRGRSSQRAVYAIFTANGNQTIILERYYNDVSYPSSPTVSYDTFVTLYPSGSTSNVGQDDESGGSSTSKITKTAGQLTSGNKYVIEAQMWSQNPAQIMMQVYGTGYGTGSYGLEVIPKPSWL
jgi:hypothetical protein